MSKLFLSFGLLASAMFVPAWSLHAQEEPIAVAAPVSKDASKDEATSAAVKADAAKLDAIKLPEPQSSSDKRVRPLTVSVQLLRSDLVITGALTDSTYWLCARRSAKPAFHYLKLPVCVSHQDKIPAPRS